MNEDEDTLTGLALDHTGQLKTHDRRLDRGEGRAVLGGERGERGQFGARRELADGDAAAKVVLDPLAVWYAGAWWRYSLVDRPIPSCPPPSIKYLVHMVCLVSLNLVYLVH